MKGKIWYACYGSNILLERFRCYIKGGKCRFNGKTYAGCADDTMPTESLPIVIPYEMYFGNCSSWDGYGAAFLDTSKPSATLGRMYLITEEQFAEIKQQEGDGPNWYHHEQHLGEHRGYPIKTLTNSKRRPANAPSTVYLQVIADGVKEMLGEVIIPSMYQQGGQPSGSLR